MTPTTIIGQLVGLTATWKKDCLFGLGKAWSRILRLAKWRVGLWGPSWTTGQNLNEMMVGAVSDHVVAATSQEGWTEMEGNRVPENTRTYNPNIVQSPA